MTLTTPLDLIYDEQLLNFGIDSTDSDKSQADYTASNVATPINGLNLNFYSSPTGFPQFAEKTSFVSSDKAVTNWSLVKDSSGTAFSTTTGVATTLQVNDGGTLKTVYLYATSNSDIIVGRLGATISDPNNPPPVALVIALDDTDLNHPNIWVSAYAPFVHSTSGAVPTGIDDNDVLNLANLVYVRSDFSTVAENAFNNFSGVSSGQDQFAMVSPQGGVASGTVDLLFTGFTFTGSGTLGTVNVSTQGLGVNAQAIDPGEAIRVDIVSANSADFAKEAGTGVHYANNISYQNHLAADWASFQVTQVNPTGKNETISVKLYSDSTNVKGTDSPDFVHSSLTNEGSFVSILSYQILDASGNDITATFGGTASLSGGVLTVTNLPVFDQIKVYTDAMHTFDRMLVENTGTAKAPTFDIGNIKVQTVSGGSGTEYTEEGSHLKFEDGGPSVTSSSPSNGVISVDESLLGTDGSADLSGLFTVGYGPDGAGSVGYVLGVDHANEDSGLVDTATGSPVLLNYDSVSKTVIGSINSGATTVLTISVNSSGTVNLDQARAVMHPTGTDPDGNETKAFSSANLVTLTATASDSEANADTASATASIGNAFVIKDDGAQHISALDGTANFAAGSSVTKAVTFSTATDAAGNDGSHLTIAKYADLSSIGLTAFLNADANDLIYKDSSGNGVYELKAIDGATENSGSYEFDVLQQVASPPQPLNFSGIKSGSPQETLTVPTQDNAYSVVFDGLLFFNSNGTPISGSLGNKTQSQLNFYDDTTAATAVGDQLNPDNIGFGVKNGQASQINDGEGFFFNTNNGSQQLSLQFDVAGIGNINTIHYEYWVFDASGNELTYSGDKTVTGLTSGNQHVNITDSGTPFDTAYVHFYFTPTDTNSGVRIINFKSQVATQTPDTVIHFQLQNTDGDGDFIGSNDFSVKVDNPNTTTTQTFTLDSTIAAASINSGAAVMAPLSTKTLNYTTASSTYVSDATLFDHSTQFHSHMDYILFG